MTRLMRKLKKFPKEPLLPSDASIAKISSLLTKQYLEEEKQRKYARVKEVLALLGKGALLSAAVLAPKSAPLLKKLMTESPDWEEWKRYNASYLRRTLQRLEQQKHIAIKEENGQQVITLTKNGRHKILRYSLDMLTIEKPKRWDDKWRLVLYDIPVSEKQLGDIVRQSLRTLGFYAIQDSVYIYPFPCFEQIEFIREYYGLGDNIQYMLVDHIERDGAFKTYFNVS